MNGCSVGQKQIVQVVHRTEQRFFLSEFTSDSKKSLEIEIPAKPSALLTADDSNFSLILGKGSVMKVDR